MAELTSMASSLMLWGAGRQTGLSASVPLARALAGVQDGSWMRGIKTYKRHDYQRGSMAPGELTTNNVQSGKAQLKLNPNYDDIGIWLEMMFGYATPSGSSMYTRVWNGRKALRTESGYWSLALGPRVDNENPPSDHQMVYGCVVPKLTLSCAGADQPTQMTVDVDSHGWMGSGDAEDFMVSSEPAVDFIEGSHWGIAFDTHGTGTYGATDYDRLIGFKLTISSGVSLGYYMDGTYNPKRVLIGPMTVDLTTTLDCSGGSLFPYLSSGTAKNVQLQAAYGKSLSFNMPLYIPDVPQYFKSSKGQAVVDVRWRLQDHSSLAEYFTVTSVGSLADLSTNL